MDICYFVFLVQLLVHLQEKCTFSMKNENEVNFFFFTCCVILVLLTKISYFHLLYALWIFQDIDATQELEVCQNMNSKLLR